jgi:hypothetical protein
MPNSMRKLLAILASSLLLCIGSFTGTYASTPVPDRRVDATELRMYVPSQVTCVIGTVATVYAAILKPALGLVAPASLVAVDGGIEYLALLRSMKCLPDRCRRLISQLRDGEQKIDTLYPSRR